MMPSQTIKRITKMRQCPVCGSDITVDAQYGDANGLTVEVSMWCLDDDCNWAGGSSTIYVDDIVSDLS
jgi:hypothetical protein